MRFLQTEPHATRGFHCLNWDLKTENSFCCFNVVWLWYIMTFGVLKATWSFLFKAFWLCFVYSETLLPVSYFCCQFLATRKIYFLQKHSLLMTWDADSHMNCCASMSSKKKHWTPIFFLWLFFPSSDRVSLKSVSVQNGPMKWRSRVFWSAPRCSQITCLTLCFGPSKVCAATAPPCSALHHQTTTCTVLSEIKRPDLLLVSVLKKSTFVNISNLIPESFNYFLEHIIPDVILLSWLHISFFFLSQINKHLFLIVTLMKDSTLWSFLFGFLNNSGL